MAEQDDAGLGGSEVRDRAKERVRLHYHAGPAAESVVIRDPCLPSAQFRS